MSVSFVSPIRHVCWALIRHVGLRKSMLVTDKACRSPTIHVCLQWVFVQAFCSPIGHVGLIRVSNEAIQGLQSGMSVSDLRWVSDWSLIINMFLNSLLKGIFHQLCIRVVWKPLSIPFSMIIFCFRSVDTIVSYR